MLARGVRMRGIEQERLEDRACRGPCPGLACGRKQERGEDRRKELTTHE
jgi:hypothetical protein